MAGEQKTNKPKRVSEEAVLSRARRMMRSEKKKLWAALGFEGDYDDAKFEENIAAIAKDRESAMTDGEKNEQRIKDLEAKVADLNGKLASAHENESKAKQALQLHEKKAAKQAVENEIKDAARQAGIRDPDYAVHLYREHLRRLPEDQREKAPMPEQFFGETLKKDAAKKHLFAEEVVAAGPKTVAETQPAAPTAPAVPASQPAAPKPGESDVGTKESVEKLDQREFAKRTSEKYGFRPTMFG